MAGADGSDDACSRRGDDGAIADLGDRTGA